MGFFQNRLLEPVEFKISLLKTESKALLRAGFTEKEVTDISQLIMQLLQTASLTPGELFEKSAVSDKNKFKKVLQFLLEEGKITENREGKICST